MTLVRHCDQCNMAINKNQVYIDVSFKHDADIKHTLVAGLPFPLIGDYCSTNCLTTRLNQLMGDK